MNLLISSLLFADFKKCLPYPFENDDPLLVVFIRGDVEHGPPVTWHDGVLYFGIFPDVQVMGFDSSDSRAHCGRLRNPEMKETCQTKIRPDSFIIIT